MKTTVRVKYFVSYEVELSGAIKKKKKKIKNIFYRKNVFIPTKNFLHFHFIYILKVTSTTKLFFAIK